MLFAVDRPARRQPPLGRRSLAPSLPAGLGRPISALSGANDSCFIAGDVGKQAMKAVLLGAVVAITSALAHAEDMAEMISRYRHAHGLSTVKTDPQLTAIAERVGDPELAMPLATEPGAVEQPKIDFLGL
jgi:hypothetical protein